MILLQTAQIVLPIIILKDFKAFLTCYKTMSLSKQQQMTQEENELFEVEDIVNDSLIEDLNGQIIHKWLVKWKGLNENENTWETQTHLQHLEIWEKYQQKNQETIIKASKCNNNDNNNNNNKNVDFDVMEQFYHLKQCYHSTNLLINHESRHLLFDQKSVKNAVQISKIEKLISFSENKLLSNLSSLGPQLILNGILFNHKSYNIYKKCISYFISKIENKKIELQTMTDLNNLFAKRLVEFIKIGDYELVYLSLTLLNYLSINNKMHPIVFDQKYDQQHINILCNTIKKNKDCKMINNVISFLTEIGKKNMKILFKYKIFELLLLFICKPWTEINTLILISTLISNVVQYRALLNNSNILIIIKCIDYLLCYNIDSILQPILYSCNYLINYSFYDKHNVDIFLNYNNYNKTKKEIGDKSYYDELLIIGITKKWKILSIPFVIILKIKSYFSPFGQQQIKTMKFNKIERFVELMRFKSFKCKTYDIILLCGIIAAIQKQKEINEIENILGKMHSFGIIENLKLILKTENCMEHDIRSLMLISTMIRWGNAKQIKKIMDSSILFPFILKVTCYQKLDDFVQKCVYTSIATLIRKQQKAGIDVLDSVDNEISKILKHKKVCKEDKTYLRSILYKFKQQKKKKKIIDLKQ